MSLMEKARNSVFKRMVNGDLSVENAVIISKWSNFAGRPTDLNPNGGKRTFDLVLTEDIADELKAEGWNIKYREPKEEGDDPLIFTEIVVNMESKYPPKVVLYSEVRGKKRSNRLYGDDVKELDTIDMENMDVIVHPYEHGRGQYKVKGYANAIYVVQASQASYFDDKYADWDYPEE